jgi:Cu/Zn superoxide dismutase
MTRSQLRLGIVLGSVFIVSVAAVVTGCSDDPPPAGSSSGTSGASSSSGSSGTSSSSGTSGSTASKKATATVAPYAAAGGTTQGTATFTEANGEVTLDLSVTNAVPGARGVHVHVGGSCDSPPGAHFNPNATTKNGEWDNMQVAAGGAGTLSSKRAGLTLEPAADGGTGIVGRTIVIHAAPVLYPDGGPVLTEAGTPAPPPISGCGVIKAQ